MLVPDRRRRLTAEVRRRGSVEVSELAAQLGVSPWTIRRDLGELERQGVLRRTRGGAFTDFAAPTSDGAPNDETRSVKDRIGRSAADRLADDTTVLVLAGSTTLALVAHLAHRRMTVVTNGLHIAAALEHAPGIGLVVLGGVLHRDQMTLLGPLTEQSMRDLHVDLIVAGAYGVDPDVGVTGAKVIQAGYHHGMLQHADGLMVVADSSKLGRRGSTLLAGIDVVDTLVTDTDAPPDTVGRLRSGGIDVVVC